VRHFATSAFAADPGLHWKSVALRLRKRRLGVNTVGSSDSPEPAGPLAASNDPSVEVLANEARIHELCIERPAIVAYLRTIPPGKQAIALVHALEVGVTEMLARRERFGR
jgi:hypothetical protein